MNIFQISVKSIVKTEGLKVSGIFIPAKTILIEESCRLLHLINRDSFQVLQYTKNKLPDSKVYMRST